MITPDMTVTLHPIESLPPLPPIPLSSSYTNIKRKNSEVELSASTSQLKKLSAVPSSDTADVPANHQLVRTHL